MFGRTSVRLFKHVPPIDNGMLVVPDEPGLGLDFDAAVIERYEVK